MKNFLFEILVQEMPYKFIPQGIEQLKNALIKLFEENELNFGGIKTYATPRRFAVLVEGLDESQKDIIKDVRGPILNVAKNDTGYTPAAVGFAKKNGVSESDLFEKEGYIWAKVEKKGKKTADVLNENLESIVLKMQGPHFMRWADYEQKFTRPVDNVLAVFGNETLNFKIVDKTCSNKTKGHRFSSVKEVEIKDPLKYKELLKAANVIADVEERKEKIVASSTELAEKNGLRVDFTGLDDLLDEVVYITEYPVPVLCEFKQKYLEIPDIVTTTVMSKHQRYFPLYDKATGKLSNKFITMANFVGTDEASFDNIKAGNQRVISARLEDGIFFYNEDTKTPLEAKIDDLKGMTFQRDLGTLFDKTARIEKLSEFLCEETGCGNKADVLRAAKLCKADLSTSLVFEFTELQGFIGENYALKSGEKVNVAKAVKEHYFPLNANSDIPSSLEGSIVSIADKIDTVTAIFVSTQENKKKRPTGSNDPLGVRRAVIGVLRILTENNLKLDIEKTVDYSIKLIQDGFNFAIAGDLKKDILDFMTDRLFVMYEKEFDPEILEALRTKSPLKNLNLFVQKAEELKSDREKAEFKNFVEQIKRVSRITSDADNALFERIIKEANLSCDEEKKLFAAVDALDKTPALQSLYGLTPLIEAFFEAVLVNDEDEDKKNDRLAILINLRKKADAFADFTKFKKQ